MDVRATSLVLLCALLTGIGNRAEARIWSEEDFGTLPMVEHVFALSSDGTRERTVIGESANYTPTEGDTLYDIGRYFGHGYNEMAAANPGIDPWIPARSERTASPSVAMSWVAESDMKSAPPRIRPTSPEPRSTHASATTVSTVPSCSGRIHER